MSLMDTTFDEVKDLRSVEPGEYKIRITKAEQGAGKSTGNPYIMLTVDIADVPDAKSFRHIMMLPTEGDDDKKAAARMRGLKYFFQAVKVDTTGMTLAMILNGGTLDRLEGAEAWAILIEEDSDDPQYGTQNRIKRWV